MYALRDAFQCRLLVGRQLRVVFLFLELTTSLALQPVFEPLYDSEVRFDRSKLGYPALVPVCAKGEESS